MNESICILGKIVVFYSIYFITFYDFLEVDILFLMTFMHSEANLRNIYVVQV